MNIGIDIRSLMNPARSGVGEYTHNLLDHLFQIDQKNRYFLFYNSFANIENVLPKEWRGLENIRFCGFKWPNKLFNASLKFFGWPKIDKLVGGREKIDTFFIPNIQFLSLSEQCKKVITVHDLSFEIYPEFYSLKRRLWHKAINPRKMISGADKVIAVSENTRRDLLDLYGLEPEKVKVVYSGVKIEGGESGVEKIREKYRLPDNFILYLGTLEPRKNIIGSIKAFEKFVSGKSSIVNCCLVIAGYPGWNYREMRKTAQKSKAADKIKFIGDVDSGDKPALYKLASVFIYPSFYEGFGFPPLEAMACGTPVVTSLSSSLGEISGQAALLVDPYNVNEISEAISQILTSESLRADLIKKGREQAKKFDWQKTAENTLRFLVS